MVTIPFLDFPYFKIEVELDGTPYSLSFKWNSYGGFWSVGFKDIAQNELVNGIKLVLNYEHLKQFPDRGLPPGELWVIDPSSDTSKIQQYDFLNDRCFLNYVTEDEVETIRA